MATGTVATSARRYHTDQAVYVTCPIIWSTAGTYVIGTLPAGAAVLRAGVIVTTAFAGGTPQTLGIGVTGTLTSYGSALTLTTVGVISGAGMATSTKSVQTVDTDMIATLSAGATPSAGAGYVFVEYIMVARS